MQDYTLKEAVKILHNLMKNNLVKETKSQPYLKAEIGEFLDNTNSLWPGGFANDWSTQHEEITS